MATVEDIVSGFSQECGCYEETCLIWPFEMILHLEPDGTGDAFFDAGDEVFEKNFPATTIEELREAACSFVDELFAQPPLTLPTEN